MQANEKCRVTDRVEAVCGFIRPVESRVRIVGHVVAELFGPDGRLKQREEIHNLITDVGDNYLASLAYGTSGWTYRMKTGSASTAAAKNGAGSFVAVADYNSGSAHAMDATYPKVGVSNNIAQFKVTWAAGENTNTIRRVGIVDNATDAGEADASHTAAMAVFDADIPKGASDTLAVTWTWTLLGA
jgi:hypothetical protein